MYKLCKTEQSAQRQRQLEEGLLAAMKTKRYEEITISDLCTQMGIPRKSFYRYFSSKDGALHALIDHTLLDFEQYTSLRPGLSQISADQDLRQFFEFWQRHRQLLDALERSGLSGVLVQRAISQAQNEHVIPRYQAAPEIRRVQSHAVAPYRLHRNPRRNGPDRRHTADQAPDSGVMRWQLSVFFDEHVLCNVKSQVGITAIDAAASHTVGLCTDGTVRAVGHNSHRQCNVDDWTDITAIAANGGHTVGLRADGTVRTVGYNVRGQCNVQDWTDVAAIWAGPNFTAAMRKNGELLCTDPEIQTWLRKALA